MSENLTVFRSAQFDGYIYAEYHGDVPFSRIRYSLFRSGEVIDQIHKDLNDRQAVFQGHARGDYTVLVELLSGDGGFIASDKGKLEIGEDIAMEPPRRRQAQSLKGGQRFYDNIDKYVVEVKFEPGGLDKLATEQSPHLRLFSRLRDSVGWVKVFDETVTRKRGMGRLAELYRLEGSVARQDMLQLAEELESLCYVVYCSITPDTTDLQPPPLEQNPAAETASPIGNVDQTPDFNALQTYLDAPQGMNVRAAWNHGITGKGVSIRHLDGGVYRNHEDLKGNITVVTSRDESRDCNHGTASTGCIAAANNGFGVTGIAHDSNFYFYESVDLNLIVRDARPGDIVSLDVQFRVNDKWLPAIDSKVWWDRIAALVEHQVIVILAAGNGGLDLSPGAGNLNDYGDSGSMLVGACHANGGARVFFSNYNHYTSCINSWGDWTVVTTGYGSLQNSGDNNRKYTKDYGGTSSATPLCSGALALIQSYMVKNHNIILNSLEMRQLIEATGYAEGRADGIGFRPNVYGSIPETSLTISPDRLPNGQAGTVYPVQTLTVAGGTAPYTYKVYDPNKLPPGLSLDPVSGKFSGMPTEAGEYSFRLGVTDANGIGGGATETNGWRQYTLAIWPITISPGSLPNGPVGKVYPAQKLTVSGGTAPYTYKVHDPSNLPPGLSLDPDTGEFSGTPTRAGEYKFWLGATDANGIGGGTTGTNGWRQYTLAIWPILISPDSLKVGQIGTYYLTPLTIGGGQSPYSLALASGQLPPGLKLFTGKSCSISGTPTQAGKYPFTVKATDANSLSGEWSYILVITSSVVLSPTEPTLPGGTQGLPYAMSFTASGGAGPYTFHRVIDDDLPPGLTLGYDNGVLSGTPTKVGSFSFKIRAYDANNNFATKIYTLTIAAEPVIMVGPERLPNGQLGVAYPVQRLTALGGTAPYTYQVHDASKLPTGLSLNPNTGVFSGTPTKAGEYTFRLGATDANGSGGGITGTNGWKRYTVRIWPLAISPDSLPVGEVKHNYWKTLKISGGQELYSIMLSSGQLPPGLRLEDDTNSGGEYWQLQGTPIQEGVFAFTVKAIDANGLSGEQSYALAITSAVELSPIEPTLPGGTQGLPYATSFTASGGTFPYTFHHVGNSDLPPGLALNKDNGRLSGTPTKARSFSFNIVAYDANGNLSDVRTYTLSIAAATARNRPAGLAVGTIGRYYQERVAASGGTAPYTYTASGTLPTNVELLTDGAIVGTPVEAGSFLFMVTATDADGYSGERVFTLVIAAAPTIMISPQSLEGGKIDRPYSAALTASGGTAPYTYSASGALPRGVDLSPGGAISGKPVEAGSYHFTVAVTDANGHDAEQAYRLNIAAAPTIVIEIEPAGLPEGQVE